MRGYMANHSFWTASDVETPVLCDRIEIQTLPEESFEEFEVN
jgi:hypothetical protein